MHWLNWRDFQKATVLLTRRSRILSHFTLHEIIFFFSQFDTSILLLWRFFNINLWILKSIKRLNFVNALTDLILKLNKISEKNLLKYWYSTMYWFSLIVFCFAFKKLIVMFSLNSFFFLFFLWTWNFVMTKSKI